MGLTILKLGGERRNPLGYLCVADPKSSLCVEAASAQRSCSSSCRVFAEQGVWQISGLIFRGGECPQSTTTSTKILAVQQL